MSRAAKGASMATKGGAVGDLDTMGPIDYLVVEYPEGRITGEAAPYLLDLVDRGTIRIIDIAFAEKAYDGSVQRLGFADLPVDAQQDLSIMQGAGSGVIGPDDIDEVGAVLEPGSAAGILVFENAWAAPFAAAMRRTGARLIANGRIPVQELLAALDTTEAEGRPAT